MSEKPKMQIFTRPLDRWPRDITTMRKVRPFRTNWTGTWQKIRHELRCLEARTVILQLAIDEKDISTVSGLPRDDRMPRHSGVIIAADTKHGALKWVCDDCVRWRDNVHAIALTLERLRLADLYGVTKSGEQYAGWKMLPGPITAVDGGSENHMTLDAAARFVAGLAGVAPGPLLAGRGNWVTAYRAAAKTVHADRAGHDPKKWKQLEDAAKLLNDLHSRR
jgi:hypothetical protein